MRALVLLSIIAVAFASQECGENEHFESCGTACPLTCKNYQDPPEFCILRCDIGCQCDEGYVRSEDGRCVKPEQCPASMPNIGCGENEHFESCGTACPLTCENYQDPPKACVLSCNIGCHCDKGYVRSSDGRCVKPEQCPSTAPQQCGENEHFETCGTACPLTCENYQDPPKACVLRCDIGCHCDKGYVRSSDGRCVRPEQCPSSAFKPKTTNCVDKPETGMCMAYFRMWYYDAVTQQCHKFIYGGCGGNGNRYESEEECMKSCEGVVAEEATTEACDMPSETGVCRGFFPRFYFDRTTGTCQKFIYGGCGGNENNFETIEDCQQKCGKSAPSACMQEKVVGPCRAIFPRFYYNKETKECEKFNYGGCQGNSNNFLSKEDCESVCKRTECGENEHFESCGTACPLTCENYKNPPKFCIKRCDIGCHCDEGYVRSKDGRCVKPEQCPATSTIGRATPSACLQEKVEGPCRANFKRFYYNKETKNCEKFIYGGCLGNSNNFNSKEECEAVCKLCDENEHFESCGTLCPLTCKNYKNPPKLCSDLCDLGCHCDEGYVQDDDGRCIKPEQCPASSPFF